MRIWQHLTVGAVGGLLYVGLELLYRGRSHVSMFLVGGICFFVIGMLDTAAPSIPLLWQMLLGSFFITAMELLCGAVVNLGLGLGVWDYSRCPFNLKGQICLQYSLLWMPISLAAVFLEDFLRLALFSQPLPAYRWV